MAWEPRERGGPPRIGGRVAAALASWTFAPDSPTGGAVGGWTATSSPRPRRAGRRGRREPQAGGGWGARPPVTITLHVAIDTVFGDDKRRVAQELQELASHMTAQMDRLVGRRLG